MADVYLKAMGNWDKDQRFMAASDLAALVMNDTGSLRPHHPEIKKAFLDQLEDASPDVQGNAVKCLSTITHKFDNHLMCEVITKLCEMIVGGDEKLKDVHITCLRTLLLHIPKSLGESFMGASLPTLKESLVGSMCGSICDLFAEILKTFPSTPMKDGFDIAKRLLSLVDNSPEVARKASGTLGHVLRQMSMEAFLQVEASIMTSLGDDWSWSRIIVLSNMVKQASSRMTRGDDVFGVLHTSLNKALEEEELQNIDLICEAMELLVKGRQTPELLTTCNELMSYNPNVYDEGEDLDDEYYSEDDDESWRVRNWALKLAGTIFMTCTYDMYSLVLSTLLDTIASRLTDGSNTVRMQAARTIDDAITSFGLCRLQQPGRECTVPPKRFKSEDDVLERQLAKKVMSVADQVFSADRFAMSQFDTINSVTKCVRVIPVSSMDELACCQHVIACLSLSGNIQEGGLKLFNAMLTAAPGHQPQLLHAYALKVADLSSNPSTLPKSMTLGWKSLSAYLYGGGEWQEVNRLLQVLTDTQMNQTLVEARIQLLGPLILRHSDADPLVLENAYRAVITNNSKYFVDEWIRNSCVMMLDQILRERGLVLSNLPSGTTQLIMSTLELLLRKCAPPKQLVIIELLAISSKSGIYLSDQQYKEILNSLPIKPDASVVCGILDGLADRLACVTDLEVINKSLALLDDVMMNAGRETGKTKVVKLEEKKQIQSACKFVYRYVQAGWPRKCNPDVPTIIRKFQQRDTPTGWTLSGIVIAAEPDMTVKSREAANIWSMIQASIENPDSTSAPPLDLSTAPRLFCGLHEILAHVPSVETIFPPDPAGKSVIEKLRSIRETCTEEAIKGLCLESLGCAAYRFIRDGGAFTPEVCSGSTIAVREMMRRAMLDPPPSYKTTVIETILPFISSHPIEDPSVQDCIVYVTTVSGPDSVPYIKQFMQHPGFLKKLPDILERTAELEPNTSVHLEGLLPRLVELLNEPSVETRTAVLRCVPFFAKNYGDVLVENGIIPKIVENLQPRPDLVTVVDLFTCKYREDAGLPLRKAALQAFTSCYSRTRGIGMYALSIIVVGLADEEDEVVMGACFLLMSVVNNDRDQILGNEKNVMDGLEKAMQQRTESADSKWKEKAAEEANNIFEVLARTVSHLSKKGFEAFEEFGAKCRKSVPRFETAWASVGE